MINDCIHMYLEAVGINCWVFCNHASFSPVPNLLFHPHCSSLGAVPPMALGYGH